MPPDISVVQQNFHFPETPGRRRKAGSITFHMDVTVELASVLERLETAVRQTVFASATDAMVDAKKLAPVRRVLKGDRGGKTRLLTRQERSAEQSVRVQLGLRSGKAIRTAAEPARTRSLPSNPYLRAPGRRPPRGVPDELGKRTQAPDVNFTGKAFAIGSGVQLNRYGRSELGRGVAIQGPTIFGQGDDATVRRNRARLRAANSAIYFRPAGRSSGSEGAAPSGQYKLGGRLRGEIYIERADEPTGVFKWWVISPTYYSRYVEFGTRHNKAQPYMRPALAMQRRKLADNLRTNLRKLNWKPKRKHVRTRAI